MPTPPPPAVNIKSINWPPPSGGTLGISFNVTFGVEAGEWQFQAATGETNSVVAASVSKVVNGETTILVSGELVGEGLMELIAQLNSREVGDKPIVTGECDLTLDAVNPYDRDAAAELSFKVSAQLQAVNPESLVESVMCNECHQISNQFVRN